MEQYKVGDIAFTIQATLKTIVNIKQHLQFTEKLVQAIKKSRQVKLQFHGVEVI